MSIIYKTTNLVNGKFYIGKHYNDINDNYLGSGIKLNNDIKKYGKENFKREILEYCTLGVDQREIYWIETLNARNPDIGYNINMGGCGVGNGKNNPMFGKHWNHSDETKKKLSESHKGIKRSNETLIKMSMIQKGKILSIETKRKISIGNKNKIVSDETKRKISQAKIGIKFSNEHKRKLSDARKNRIITDETRKKLSEAGKRRYKKN